MEFNGCLDQEHVRIRGQVGMQFPLVIDTAMGGVKKFVYGMDRPAILKGCLVGMCVDDNWEIWV